MPPPWKTVAAYGLLAATMLACLYLVGLAPLSLGWGRELLGAAIAIVALVVGLRLAERRGAMPARDAGNADSTPDAPGAAGMPALSARERQILNLLADGLSNKEMARTLSLSENTIKTHLANLYAKLDVGRRTEALAVARRYRLLPG